MKAYCMDGRVIDVVQADKYVKWVDKEAAYMADAGTYTLMLIPSDKTEIEAGHAIVKIEDILKKCGLENVLVTVNDKEYVALDEVKKAIRALHEGE